MKKLLIFMLVLGMASMASAVTVPSDQTFYFQMDISGPQADFYTGDTITIDIYAGDTIAVTDMLSTVLNISTAASAGTATISNAGDWGTPPTGINLTTTADGSGGFNVNVHGIVAAAGIPTGASIYSVSFVAGAAGTVTIDAASGTWSGWGAAVGPVDGFNDGTTPGYEIYGLPYAQVTVIPEPMTIALLGLGGLALLRRRK